MRLLFPLFSCSLLLFVAACGETPASESDGGPTVADGQSGTDAGEDVDAQTLGDSGVAFSCEGISNAPNSELCVETEDSCEGVFLASQGCVAFCAAAGLECVARFGGGSGCSKEAIEIPCGEENGHGSDYCVCGGDGGGGGGGECGATSDNPATAKVINYRQGVYTALRSSWVVGCPTNGFDYAYTAQDGEHVECDAAYVPGSAVGIATFTFANVAPGRYGVFIQGRHTPSRNPLGAKVIVNTGTEVFEKRISQRDDSFGFPKDLHGNYCLSGTVTVTLDSSEANLSDSIQNVYLTPVP